MPPAARLTDMHTCPLATPGTPPIPHVGGPVTGPGIPTVLIGNMPAATVGDMAVCVGPPDAIVKGSCGVFIGGKPAARMGDNTAHGGVIVAGFPTVMIGEIGNAVVTPSLGAALAGAAPGFPAGGGAAGAQAGAAAMRASVPAPIAGAAGAGTPPQNRSEKRSWFRARVAHADGAPAENVPYKLTFPDGTERTGMTGRNGVVAIGAIDPGQCQFSLTGLDRSAWKRA